MKKSYIFFTTFLNYFILFYFILFYIPHFALLKP
jgi:hypothetical protein